MVSHTSMSPASRHFVLKIVSIVSASIASARSGPGTKLTMGGFSVIRACVSMYHLSSRSNTGICCHFRSRGSMSRAAST